MTNPQNAILAALRGAFPARGGGIGKYIAAYDAYLSAPIGMQRAALANNQAAYAALSEDERKQIGAVLDPLPMRI